LNCQTKDEEENSPLHLSVLNGSLRITELLISKGADPHAKNKNGDTPLHLSAKLNRILHLAYFLHIPSVKQNMNEINGDGQNVYLACFFFEVHFCLDFTIGSNECT